MSAVIGMRMFREVGVTRRMNGIPQTGEFNAHSITLSWNSSMVMEFA